MNDYLGMYDVFFFAVLGAVLRFFKKEKQSKARAGNKKGNKKVIKEKDQRRICRQLQNA